MKMSIIVKLMGIMLILTMIPLAVLGFVALQDSKAMGLSVVNDAKSIGDTSIQDSTTALNQLGEQIIQQKALDVSKQLDLYIKDHPGMTVSQLQADPTFSALAVQPVGKTGYTTVMDATTLINRFHSNPKNVNTDYNTYATTNPGYFAVLSKGANFQDSSGYYDWKDADGVMRPKFAYYTVLPTATADGVRLRIGATTYINEFSAPAKQTETAIKSKLDTTTAQIKAKTESVGTQNTILIVTLITMLIVIIVSYFFAMSITRPIKKLTEVANNVSLGDLSDTEIDITSDDEIGELAGSFKRMVVSVKYYMKKSKSG
jgi:HAMP domain-containing protein